MVSRIIKNFNPLLRYMCTNPKPLLLAKQLSHLTAKNHEKRVFISNSYNIYENLALEEWFFKNWSYDNRELLMLWSNSPCVVFGRHQNPWEEADLCYLSCNNILPARRNSGGGTVYHDLGNLNCTFFTSRIHYHRKRNLSFICEVLNKQWGVNSSVSDRDDILLDGKLKISGTASKLASKNAYHHCTLLINSEFKSLSQALRAPQVPCPKYCLLYKHLRPFLQVGISSKATSSVPATVTKLSLWNPSATVGAVQLSLSQQFLGSAALQDNVHYVTPNDEDFPG